LRTRKAQSPLVSSTHEKGADAEHGKPTMTIRKQRSDFPARKQLRRVLVTRRNQTRGGSKRTQ